MSHVFPRHTKQSPPVIAGGEGCYLIDSAGKRYLDGSGGAAVSYAVSKAGLIQLARQIAVDYGSQGIRANAIQPSAIQGSNLSRHAGEDRAHQTTPPASLPRPKPWLPIRRQGHPRDEYGATVAFLLSDDAGFITGASLPVDGGYLAT